MEGADADNELIHLRVGDFDGRKPCAAECVRTDFNNGIGDNKLGYAAVSKRVVVNAFDFARFGERELSQSAAAVERKVAYFDDIVGDNNVGQA